MKRLVPVCLFLIQFSVAQGQASNTWSVKFSNAILSRYTPTINAMTGKGWEYSNTIILHGIEKVYNQVNTAGYLNYIKGFIDTYLNADGSFKATVTLTSLDRIHPGISVLFLYEKLKSNAADSAKYRTAATNLRNVLVGAGASYAAFRTPVRKIFWHKQSGYDNISMLDGIYMAHPFLAKYGRLFGDNAAIDTAVNQTLFDYNQLFQAGSSLIKHAWKEPGSSGVVAWADASGNSTSVWSRAMGWFVMALVDELKYVPAAHPRRGELLTALSNLAAGIKNYQDPSSKLWFQVVDKNSVTLSGNYLETSGSGMFIYALKTAVDSGWISSATYLPVAQSAWTAIQTKIATYSDGMPQIRGFAPAMSVQNTEALYVQASLQPVDVPTLVGTQHPHGYAAILMAASAMEFPLVTLPVGFISFSAEPTATGNQLKWLMGDETDVDYYAVERSFTGSNFSQIGTVPGAGKLQYGFPDPGVSGNTVFYRINAITRNGAAHYSAIVSLRKTGSRGKILISPNPVENGQVNLVIRDMKAGTYHTRIFNSGGISLSASQFSVTTTGTMVKTVQLPAGAGPGLYFLTIEGNGTKSSYSFENN